MKSFYRQVLGYGSPQPPWSDSAPVREELFGPERLEQHAESLAAAQAVTLDPPRVMSLHSRLADNAAALLSAYRASAAELASGNGVVHAAEWLLDNYHLVEEQIREIRDDLPPGYYRQLPKLAGGPFAGYPRVFGLAWAFVAHTDSHFDPAILARFIAAYQRVQPLTIGELWAVAITLRIVLIENLRRLAGQIAAGRDARADADALADHLLVSGSARSALESDIASRAPGALSELFAAQLAKRLRDQDPRTMPALEWLEERLGQQGLSIDEAVLHAQQRQGASNVSVRNIITSMRSISELDWAEWFESVSLVDARLREASAFAAMDFPTRNLYRSAIEQLGRGSPVSELDIAERALRAAAAAEGEDPERARDPGYHLIAEGRRALERDLGFRAPLRLRLGRFGTRMGIGGYVASNLLVGAALLGATLLALASAGVAPGWLVAFALLAFLPATELATALVNRAVAWSVGAVALPGLGLEDGVPPTLRTLVAVPTLLTGEADLLEQIERLEIHHLAGVGGELSFALLLDGVDADRETLEGDAHLLAVARRAVDALNRAHGPAPSGERFLLLHRRRVFNPSEGTWMGWERKRGKLHELNRLLRGASDTSFVAIEGRAPWVPDQVRYVITLDADTRLPRDAASRLIGKMAHPLNHPRFSPALQRIVGGYAILQPRVTPALPLGREGSLFQRVFSSPGGLDPYAAAISDVYQDLFGEGSFTGKGIYDVDAFEAALAGRVPENTLLSHDLFEGVFARAGLASDVELVEDFPSRYDVASKRQHRWTRGDWQLLPWIFGGEGARQRLPALGRWKMLDNLRRSLLAPFTASTLGLCWLLPTAARPIALTLVLAALLVPVALPCLSAAMPPRREVRLRSHLGSLGASLRLAAWQMLLNLTFLADQAWRMGDAIGRTLTRLLATRRHLLEWTTAAQTAGTPRPGAAGFYRQMAVGNALGVGMTILASVSSPGAWPWALPFAALWLLAPWIAFRVSRAPPEDPVFALDPDEARELRLIARRTWRFFETFVDVPGNGLPPDNFQEEPKPVVARRTSPTNIGLYLLSAVAARDFGWIGTLQTLERLEATLETLQRLPRFRGHFFNWYATEDMRVLDPPYVSSVDSGNLAGHLIALANACEEWRDGTASAQVRPGIADACRLAREALDELGAAKGDRGGKIAALLAEIDTHLQGAQATDSLTSTLPRLAEKAARAARTQFSAETDGVADLMFWIDAIARTCEAHARDHRQVRQDGPERLSERLQAIADGARQMALAMDFAFLLDPERKLLSIGYAANDNRLDPSCYDLLASEARLASLFAIAKGDLPTRHWFRLGRTATPIGNGSALISWSGSMFEYLMPSLVMRAPLGSLLEQTNRLVVERQQAYGRSLGIPWGISESAYNARDMEFTYQYSNFGVPGLGLKRGLAENRVIAPYATGLSTMVDPRGALRNYRALAAAGARGRHGFYEAIDYTRSRLPDGEGQAIVRSFMAHHQGMTLVAIANALQDGRMRERFHREPMIQASELLLQERMPRDVMIARPQAEELRASTRESLGDAFGGRRIPASSGGAPITHLLSNGRYAVMLTAAGSGYSRWRDIAVTRWQEDATRDERGFFIFLRDMHSGIRWSMGAQPLGGLAEFEEVVFAEDHAEYTRRDGDLTTLLDVLVSTEADGEVRRVSLTNAGRRARDVELTSYAEVVLAAPATDNAHPAFAKLFVQTEYLAEFGALIATRRPRSQGEARVWAAHFAVVEGELAADPQYESDRARFIGRGRTLASALAVTEDGPLSNSTGTVLDPVFCLRQRVAVPSGKTVHVAFWTLVAASRAELLDLIDQHHDRSAYDRAKTLAWTQAQVQLRHLDVSVEEAADFQRLAAPILYADAAFRAPADAILRGAGAQSGLWAQSISGDLPIVLLRIDDLEDIAQVRQLLRAHEYWRMKRLGVDLVIVNEHASSYMQDLQIAIETAVRSSQSRPRFGQELAQGSVYALRADLMDTGTRALLLSVARVTLLARRGPLAEQLARMPQQTPLARIEPLPSQRGPVLARRPKPPVDLEFFNGLGGFAEDGREYVIHLDEGVTTPAPWINVIANPAFGFQVSAEGSGYTWAENSRENQLTPWSNDPVMDPSGEALYIRDEENLDLWCPTVQPLRDGGRYLARHGHGYSRFEHQAKGIVLELLHYVALADPIRISRLTLRNPSSLPRRLSVTAYSEWVLGTSRAASAPFIVSEVDGPTGALFARNPWSTAFPGRVAFADLAGHQTAWSADRGEFLGRNGSLAAPQALLRRADLSGRTGAGLDPCAALQRIVELEPGETREVVWFVGQCQSAEAARSLIERYRGADLDAVLQEVKTHWRELLGTVQVRTPDRAMDIMLNGWLLYQTLACRIWARSAFYQASGAYGFRDQLQDGMALTFVRPQETRRHLLAAAARQFVEGDVQHWWLPHSGQGVRTRISDDRLWLAYATATYVAVVDDLAVLDERVAFLEGPALRDGEHDAFFQPLIADQDASLFEHCARALDQAMQLTSPRGLPLIGGGDWNDGMNRVGEGGQGESVWLGWLLLRTVALFAPLAERREPERARAWRLHAESVRVALERDAWDGDWYRRATFDDGTWLGSRASEECRIDSIAQSWAVLSGAADPARAAQAMASLEERLVRPADGLALLFTPPFDRMPGEPGYIKGYPPGLRENGGQYSHAAMWSILAFTRLGDGDKAGELFALLNPINHARTPAQASRYKVEPYVVAADVYSVAPHVGRGGWTWYTGSAGWMHRAGMEGLLGIRREGGFLVIDPCIPSAWPGFDAQIALQSTRYAIRVDSPSARCRGVTDAQLDGHPVEFGPQGVRVPLNGGDHRLLIEL